MWFFYGRQIDSGGIFGRGRQGVKKIIRKCQLSKIDIDASFFFFFSIISYSYFHWFLVHRRKSLGGSEFFLVGGGRTPSVPSLQIEIGYSVRIKVEVLHSILSRVFDNSLTCKLLILDISCLIWISYV